MTPEELMKPRYKVTADYPGSRFIIGQILKKVKTVSGKEFVPSMLQQPDDFPHLFQPLKWWEDRKPEDMPEYLKVYYKDEVQFHKVSQWLHRK